MLWIYSDIAHALALFSGMVISERHVKRILKREGLFRRKNYCDVADIITFVEDQLKGSGRQHGYRWMAQKCLDEWLEM